MNWQCARCVQGTIPAECVLCSLRGGALKPTTDEKWAHIVCAIAHAEVLFNSVSSREPIDTSGLTKARDSLVGAENF